MTGGGDESGEVKQCLLLLLLLLCQHLSHC
jgi:hypothetical protein